MYTPEDEEPFKDEDDEENENQTEDNDGENPEMDNEHPFGSDPGDEKEKDEKPKGMIERAKSFIGGKSGKPNMKKMKAVASANNLGPYMPALMCPGCKKPTLFFEKPIMTGLRTAKVITIAAITGYFEAERDLNLVRFVCLNERCKRYWPRTGDKLMINVANPSTMIVQKNPYHIPK